MSRPMILAAVVAAGVLLAGCGSATSAGGVRGLGETEAVASASAAVSEAAGGLQANAATEVRVINGCRIEPRTECPGADLRGADLSKERLDGANLSRANLSLTWLIGANLSYAKLYYTNLRDANLSGANLTGASLTGATWTDGRRCYAWSVGSCA